MVCKAMHAVAHKCKAKQTNQKSTDGGLTRSKRSEASTPTSAKNGGTPGSNRRPFALATRQPGIHETPLPSTNHHEPVISLGSSDSTAERSSTNLHAGSRISCTQRVPRSGRSPRGLHSMLFRSRPYSDARPRMSICYVSRASCPTLATSATQSASTADCWAGS